MGSDMQAGALDRLVAGKLFGWAIVPATGERADGRGRGTDTFRPSQDIADAWEVVEHMAPRELRLGRMESGRYYANFGHQPINATADTAPLAICLAALSAVAP